MTTASTPARLPLGSAYGVEIEYMIVDAVTLDVRPWADRLIVGSSGDRTKNEVDRGDFRWSNELALHVIEIKTAGPVASLRGLAGGFGEQVRAINQQLAQWGACLLPGGMHPWMDPARETHLWPHAWSDLYATFDRIFGCHGHGWANLQSTHLNLPFSTDAEFRRLHSTLRLLLPLLPALAASSPYADARACPWLDGRLQHYAANSRRLPSVAARLIPPVITSEADYTRQIYDPITADLVDLDPEGHLEAPWVNARGIIPRFDRGTIEIRVLDTQENPASDLALLEVIDGLTRQLLATWQSWSPAAEALETDFLADIFEQSAGVGLSAPAPASLVAVFQQAGWLITPRPGQSLTLRDLWRTGLAQLAQQPTSPVDALGWAKSRLETGSLAEQLRRALGRNPSRAALRESYQQLRRRLDPTA